MKPYMTPGRFRIGGYGVDLSSITDAELASILQTATAMVQGYCTVPTHPIEYDFRGGTVSSELQDWELGHELLPGQRRVLPRYTPVKAVDSFYIDVTGSQYLSFTDNELYVDPNSIEITSLSMTGAGLFGAAIIPNIGLVTPKARLTYSYGYHFSARGDELYASDAREWRAMDQWWDTDALEPTVYVDGVAADVGDYSIDEDEGTVTFDDPLSPNAVVTADYDYRLPTNIAEATALIAVQRLGERNMTRKGLYGLVEIAVGEVRLRRDFPRAGVQRHGVSDEVMQLLDGFKFITVTGS